MKQAVKTISARKDNIFSKKLQYSSKNYNIITNNCHDFGTEVKKEYERIPFKKKALRDLIIK
ncbi:MAG: hypothetical protein Q4D78_07540 [Neisseria zoodegmatis]|uniref:hypothetical protein n=1 Tax=Neisseria zoodegmatis TaxID=326523 RepID=UPI0026F22263|nr:hypothetical protein [Neisseria zoodegmatis]MDO5070034.1 hypothetical protein [Neisseria zoodegmatis]